MEKLPFFISLLLISLIIVSHFIYPQIVLAKNNIGKSNMLNHFSSTNYSLNESNKPKTHFDSSILLPFSASGMTTDLTSSFSSIINTQIYSGLNRQ